MEIMTWLKSHGTIAVILIGLALGGVILLLKKQPSVSGSTSTTSTTASSGLATDANGNHVVYVPVENVYSNVYSPTTTTTTTAPTPPQPPPPPAKPPITPRPTNHDNSAPPMGGGYMGNQPSLQPSPNSTRGIWIARHVVQHGETLQAIASHLTAGGVPVSWMDVYSHNSGVIRMTAASDGTNDPYKLTPGMVLSVPSLG